MMIDRPLHEVVAFRDVDAQGQMVATGPLLPLAVRKMITREVELEQMRKSEASEMAKASVKSRRRAAAATAVTAKKPLSVEDQLSATAQQFVLPELTGTV
jgi:hypothetical protein